MDCPVKQDEKLFDKIEKYYNEGLIKVIYNTHDHWKSEEGNEHFEKECKILIPIGLNFDITKIKEFVSKDENRWIILDYIVKIDRKRWTNIEFHVKIGANNVHILISFSEIYKLNEEK
jgi:hypothetical protein